MSKPDTVEQVGILRYFGDPMCSWCWGFKPVLEQVDREYPELKRITVMGGLRGGSAGPMSDELMALVRNAWMRIEEATGQPFNHDLWREHRPLSTTLPACRAVLAVRLMAPEKEWAFMVGLFGAYFTRALDPTRRETYLDVAGSMDLDLEAFERRLDSQEVEGALHEDLALTRKFGITGFPSVVLSIKESNYLISPGYQPIEGMRRAINAAYEDAGVEFTRPESGLYV
ncbi:MAG: DsbA family protein [SAR324 cluster bacterium]|nr:DsbA family protein [SAR324 cluster bacterium]